MIPQALRLALDERLPEPMVVQTVAAVGGGSIHHAFHFRAGQQAFFLKYNQADERSNFEAESRGLALLAAESPMRIPRVWAVGHSGQYAWILMEYMESGLKGGAFWEALGRGLAVQHRSTAPAFGLDQPNYIGRLPQENGWLVDWPTFWVTKRLQPMERLARSQGLLDAFHSRKLERLYAQLPQLLPATQPSLLHGDLWSGNVMAGVGEVPILVDPAVYYGDREVDIAFSRLFGGFAPGFYEGYASEWPMEAGFEERIDLYNLYPLLVHLNLFGKGYLPDVESTLDFYQ